jgi:hypothetical protein
MTRNHLEEVWIKILKEQMRMPYEGPFEGEEHEEVSYARYKRLREREQAEIDMAENRGLF